MADTPNTPDQSANPPAGPSVRILGQYVKDLSFENPGAPDTLRGSAAQPNIDLGIDVRVRALDSENFEVELLLSAKAQRENATLFVCELSYAGLFQIRGMDEQAREAFLLVEAPRLTFPFAREIVASATQNGGFPPLMLEPVDFAALYRQQLAQRAQGGAANPPAGNA
ncbi:protein-export protein SecB [Glycocaulis albus]|jgi:preprotein translocase subunit SecB|uniref:Protein-export protein SecB n=1 Tax=Glycocaulis albus TaxID=1382801 RepID=A0ABQ1XKR6_9PROT|nr:protein-export chaperone SecB [Glycocaulis albus]MBV5258571.1 protein-export chaperone SecB [Synechococcus moorigangaii CMS01]GGG96424.1 protein-export protein SecB [Glycocaulis albus]